jgi:hypothetical protein
MIGTIMKTILHEAHDEKHLEAARGGRGEHGADIEGHAAEQDVAAAEGVGEAAEDDLRQAEAEEEDADDELGLVGAGNAERTADRRQRRQHAVDGHGDAGGHDGDRHDEFAKAHADTAGALVLLMELVRRHG